MNATETRERGEVVRTMDQVRAARIPFQGNVPGAGYRLELGELEEIEADARAGRYSTPTQVLAMVQAIQSLARRTYVRFTEATQARQDAQEAVRRAEAAEARAERAEQERDKRYTSGQVGDFQASEAELVSAPLRRRVEELKADLAEARRQRDERYTKGDLDRHLADAEKHVDRWAALVSRISGVLFVNEPALKDALRTTWETRTTRAMAEAIRQIRDILETPMEGPPGPPDAA